MYCSDVQEHIPPLSFSLGQILKYTFIYKSMIKQNPEYYTVGGTRASGKGATFHSR